MERSYEQAEARKQAERVLAQHGEIVQCEKCGAYVRQKHYERHLKSAKCYMASLRKRMYASGWVQASLTGCMNYKFFRDLGLLRMEATRMPPNMTASELMERVGATEEQHALWVIAGDDRTFRDEPWVPLWVWQLYYLGRRWKKNSPLYISPHRRSKLLRDPEQAQEILRLAAAQMDEEQRELFISPRQL